MELKFDLNDKQRKDLYQLNLKSAQKRVENRAEMRALRAENKTFTADELYQKQLQRLDNQKKDCNKKFAGVRNKKNYCNNN